MLSHKGYIFKFVYEFLWLFVPKTKRVYYPAFMDKQRKQENAIWAIVPAAGIGSRMAADRPKQYLTISGKTILEHTLSGLLQVEDISGVQLCLSPSDEFWSELNFEHERMLPVIDGGAQRADSVLSGLQALSGLAKADDWVLVHDAARPCISQPMLERLFDTVAEHAVGGILAIPLADTIKRSNNNEGIFVIDKTIDRDQLWAAQTPQMFRYGLLKQSVLTAIENDVAITDEASAIEAAGHQSLLVPGSRSNIKVTYPEDLGWVEWFLSAQN